MSSRMTPLETPLRSRISAVLVFLCVLTACLLLPAVARAQDEGTDEDDAVYVAGYPNTPEAWEKEELLIRCLFRSHGIRWYSAGSVDATVRVPRHDEGRARRLLAEALLLERLDIFLLKSSPEGDRIILVTPEEVLLQEEAGEKAED